jgi:integrase
MKLSATAKETVADVQVEISQEEAAQAGSGPPGSRTRQDRSTEQPDVCQRQRTYDHATREFVAWYRSEPRLAFNRTVLLRYRIHLEQRKYAPATINLRLAAVRRIAYEAADAGLLSPALAAGIRRVKGVRRIGVRLGNWLTPEQGRRLLESTTPLTAGELRDHAMVAMLIGCGLRRAELLALSLESIQRREEHWVIADLVGKGGHVRTVPIPNWVKRTVDAWMAAAAITHGRLFRAINKAGRVWGHGMSPKVLWDVVRAAAARAAIDKLAPHDLRRTCARLCHLVGGELDQIQFLLGHVSIHPDNRTIPRMQAEAPDCRKRRLGIEPGAA